MPVMPNTIPTFPKDSRGRDQSLCTRLPCLCSPDQIPTPLCLEMAPLGPAGFQQQWLQGRLCPTHHSPERVMKSVSSVLGQIPKPAQTQPHTHLLPSVSPRNHFPSCCQILPTIQPQRWFPSRNTSLPRLFSFFVSLKCHWWLNNNEALRGESFLAMITAGKVPVVFLKKLGMMWAAGGNDEHKRQWISTKKQHNFTWRNPQAFSRQLIKQKINMKWCTQREKTQPGWPAPSGFTQPVWRGSKITGNIPNKVAISDAVGKRKMMLTAVSRRKNAKDQHKAMPLPQLVSCTEFLHFCLKNYKKEGKEYWKDNMGGERQKIIKD